MLWNCFRPFPKGAYINKHHPDERVWFMRLHVQAHMHTDVTDIINFKKSAMHQLHSWCYIVSITFVTLQSTLRNTMIMPSLTWLSAQALIIRSCDHVRLEMLCRNNRVDHKLHTVNTSYLSGLFSSRSLSFMGGSAPIFWSGFGGQYSPDKTSLLLSSLNSVFEIAGFCHLPST